MESVSQFQRYEHAYNLLNTEFFQLKEDFNDVKHELATLTEENRRLHRSLKDGVEKQLANSELLGAAKTKFEFDFNDKRIIENLESQLNMMRKERENAVEMWQGSLNIISQLENELKSLRFQTAPQTMSFEIELKKKEEEFARAEANFYKEISVLKLDLQQREEQLADAEFRRNELRVEIENLNSQLNQKNLDKRNLIQKEYGYDDALISLQNDINDLETKNISFKKENQYLKDVFQELQSKINYQTKQLADSDRRNTNLKSQLDESVQACKTIKAEYQNLKLIEQKNKEENVNLGKAIEELMEDAAMKTRKEVQELKKIYNANLEKLIDECNLLETDHSNKEAQLEKVMRAKKSLEHELEKMSLENQRVTCKENSMYEDLHRRFCTLEREKEQAVSRLEGREAEVRKLQAMCEHDREKNEKLVAEFTEKSYVARRDLERMSDEQAKSLAAIEELTERVKCVELERNELQKRVAKEALLRESGERARAEEAKSRARVVEERHGRAVFELRQLLNMQQRMGNKWKEECHVITQQSEAKFGEMRKNFENLKRQNEKLAGECCELRQREVENEKMIGVYVGRVRAMESRIKDAEAQAAEATKRMAKQSAREKMLNYEKHLLESDLVRNNFNDTFFGGKSYIKENIEVPTRP